MAARGTVTKQKIMQKILETFPGSFLYNGGKEIRINDVEDGLPIQIKLSFTAAKTPVEDENNPNSNFSDDTPVKIAETSEQVPQEPTAEEKERLAFLLEKLGI